MTIQTRNTKEIDNIINFNSGDLVVLAGAGTGKTTTLKKFTLTHAQDKILYLVFSESAQKSAQSTFPPNVLCKTAHSMAYKAIGHLFRAKLVRNYRLTEIKKLLSTSDWGLVQDTLNAFNVYITSDKTTIKDTLHPLPISPTLSQVNYAKKVRQSVLTMWLAATDYYHQFPMSDDVYLKMYCLENVDLSKHFTYILFDEAQDANPVISGLINRQTCHKLLVGDDHQQIFRWRGAENAMTEFSKHPKTTVMTLTQSFRFGREIASAANAILFYKSVFTKERLFQLNGLLTIPSAIVGEDIMKEGFHCVLHRTVSGTIETAIKNSKKKIFWVGGFNRYNTQEIMDVYYLSINNKQNVTRKKLLVEYKNYIEYQKAAVQLNDLEMKRVVRIVTKYQKSIPLLMTQLKRNACQNELQADLSVSTVHRAKGLDWTHVLLANDFPELINKVKKYSVDELKDELNLLYVGITRAILQITLNKTILEIIEKTLEFKRTKELKNPVKIKTSIDEVKKALKTLI